MSADNTIAVGKFPLEGKPGEFEFRVIEARSIEDCDDADGYPTEYIDAVIFQYYSTADIFDNEDDALNEADWLFEAADYVEYGICQFDYPRPFPKMTAAEANKIVRDQQEKFRSIAHQNRIENEEKIAEEQRKNTLNLFVFEKTQVYNLTMMGNGIIGKPYAIILHQPEKKSDVRDLLQDVLRLRDEGVMV